ncbi:unnamed protein product [Allacma fusca]|uniref:Uncharacterized protein n=1 Tax=Allacma fusca TaxID=39272 RepID=A0A8J2LE30_9HEXA|nr:unnamed protein product [Allacma fusca]
MELPGDDSNLIFDGNCSSPTLCLNFSLEEFEIILAKSESSQSGRIITDPLCNNSVPCVGKFTDYLFLGDCYKKTGLYLAFVGVLFLAIPFVALSMDPHLAAVNEFLRESFLEIRIGLESEESWVPQRLQMHTNEVGN